MLYTEDVSTHTTGAHERREEGGDEMARAQERFNEQMARGGFDAYSHHGGRQMVARYPGRCVWCFGPIAAGETVWNRPEYPGASAELRHGDCYTDWLLYSYDSERGIAAPWMFETKSGWPGNIVSAR